MLKINFEGEYNYISQRIQIHKTLMMVQDKGSNEIQLLEWWFIHVELYIDKWTWFVHMWIRKRVRIFVQTFVHGHMVYRGV